MWLVALYISNMLVSFVVITEILLITVVVKISLRFMRVFFGNFDYVIDD